MDDRDKNKINSFSNTQHYQNKNEMMINKIMAKFNVSYSEAEVIYRNIEKKVSGNDAEVNRQVNKKFNSKHQNEQIISKMNILSQDNQVINHNVDKKSENDIAQQQADKNSNDKRKNINNKNAKVVHNQNSVKQGNIERDKIYSAQNNRADKNIDLSVDESLNSQIKVKSDDKNNFPEKKSQVKKEIPNQNEEAHFTNSISNVKKNSFKSSFVNFLTRNKDSSDVNNFDSKKECADEIQSLEQKDNLVQDSSSNVKKSSENNGSSINQNVDSIISDIVPNYNEQVSIELKHVNLCFEDMKEKIDTVKEDFIRTIKRTKTEKEVFQALKDITFTIYKGEKVGIIGYNGAGKSTLLNVISGIYTPDSGYVNTNGNISPLLSLGAGFDFNYTGRDNILLNGAILGYDKEFLYDKIDEIIEFSELGEFIDVPVKNYSNGMIAKLGFSIATIVNPDILIIDEILGVGDVNFRKKSSDKMRSLMDGGTTVLLVSHSIGEIRSLCDKAIWIDKGCVREIGEVNKVCDNYLKDAEKASNEQLANIKLS